jgi:serine kinase of HPr protein (carbohydrate metabolism regulator)
MSVPSISSETLHASCVAKDGCAILIAGRSGSGKSDLALRLIDRGAKLVSDDYTLVRRMHGQLLATAPATIAGKIEVRGLGVMELENATDVPICLYVDLDREVERLPELIDTIVVAGIKLPVVALEALETSAPLKVELALARFGLKPEDS